MADYNSLAELRRAMVSGDPDRRATAYAAVYQADLNASEVLDDEPGEEVVQTLVDQDIVPESGTEGGVDAREWRPRVIELLEEIAANTGGGS